MVQLLSPIDYVSRVAVVGRESPFPRLRLAFGFPGLSADARWTPAVESPSLPSSEPAQHLAHIHVQSVEQL